MYAYQNTIISSIDYQNVITRRGQKTGIVSFIREEEQWGSSKKWRFSLTFSKERLSTGKQPTPTPLPRGE